MTILGTKFTAPRSIGGDYLRERDGLDGKEAARLLGVSQGHWRKLVGSRAEPNPDLVSTLEPGVRGAQWSWRTLLSYAVKERRAIGVRIPPFLPIGEQRYESIRGRVSGASAGEVLRLTRGAGGGAWAQLFAPRRYDLAGQQQPPALLLTPLWPAESLTAGEVYDLAQQALEVPGWAAMLDQGDPWLAVAWMTPSAFGHDRLIQVVELPIALDGPTRDASVVRQANGWLDPYEVPARDIADCLGWRAMPWWPTGTTTASTCSTWTPGHPVTIRVPVALERAHQATRYLRALTPQAPATDSDFLALLKIVDPAERTQHNRRDYSPATLPEGFELAVNIVWDETVYPHDRDTNAWRALSQILDDPQTPNAVGAELVSWVGDAQYATPTCLDLDVLPHAWQKRLRDVVEHATPYVGPSSYRWTQLEDAIGRMDATSHGAARTCVQLGTGRTPALLAGNVLAWSAPTGFDPNAADSRDVPARALPDLSQDPGDELLLVRDQDTRLVRGWLHTLGGQLVPMPAKAQWRTDEGGMAATIAAAVTGQATETIFQGMTHLREDLAEDYDLTELETLLRRVHDRPVSLPWSQLEAMVHQAVQPRVSP